MEYATPDVSGTRPRGAMQCLTTPGNTIDPRMEALGEMAADPDARAATADPVSFSMLPTGMMSLCQPRKPDPTVIRYWQALIESWRSPTIGRKRRARRARGRAREQRW